MTTIHIMSATHNRSNNRATRSSSRQACHSSKLPRLGAMLLLRVELTRMPCMAVTRTTWPCGMLRWLNSSRASQDSQDRRRDNSLLEHRRSA